MCSQNSVGERRRPLITPPPPHTLFLKVERHRCLRLPDGPAVNQLCYRGECDRRSRPCDRPGCRRGRREGARGVGEARPDLRCDFADAWPRRVRAACILLACPVLQTGLLRHTRPRLYSSNSAHTNRCAPATVYCASLHPRLHPCTVHLLYAPPTSPRSLHPALLPPLHRLPYSFFVSSSPPSSLARLRAVSPSRTRRCGRATTG